MYRKLAQEILGKKYSLSVAFIGEKKSREINKRYRRKNAPTNVLAFPLEKNTGEILLCKKVIKKDAKKSGVAYQEFLEYLVIHGMLHLKGMRHGSIMEKLERKYNEKYFRRHRRGLRHDQGRGGRISKRRKKS